MLDFISLFIGDDVSKTSAPPIAKEKVSSEPDLFAEILDIINPAQHLPIISYIYQSVTQDSISPTAKILGGGLYGGVLGAAVNIAMAIVNEHSSEQTTTSSALRASSSYATDKYERIKVTTEQYLAG